MASTVLAGRADRGGITPRRTWFVVLYVLATLMALLFLLAVLGTSPRNLFARRMPPRVFKDKPLSEIVADMENHSVIPIGTTWESEVLKAKKVSVSFWLLPCDVDALEKLANVAGVRIELPLGVEGQVLGAAHIRLANGAGTAFIPVYPRGYTEPKYANGKRSLEQSDP